MSTSVIPDLKTQKNKREPEQLESDTGFKLDFVEGVSALWHVSYWALEPSIDSVGKILCAHALDTLFKKRQR